MMLLLCMRFVLYNRVLSTLPTVFFYEAVYDYLFIYFAFFRQILVFQWEFREQKLLKKVQT